MRLNADGGMLRGILGTYGYIPPHTVVLLERDDGALIVFNSDNDYYTLFVPVLSES
jgi:hypothetical protein